MLAILAPFVYWAQTENTINLRVDLINVKNINVQFEIKKLKFSAYGQGARGFNIYEFILDIYSTVIPDKSDYKIVDRQVDITLIKGSNSWWPRLTCQPQKPQWLKIDFDKWRNVDREDMDEAVRDICQDYPDMYEHLYKEEFGYKKEDYKNVYLIFYNLFQSIGFIYILTVMGIRYYRDGPGSIQDTYDVIGSQMKFIQILQILEIMHLFFNYTKGSLIITTLQVGGRTFILFCMIEAEPRMQGKPVIFYIFLIWAIVEVIRYLYYVTNLLNLKIFVLTWLRYTIWMPLCPLGFVFEGIIVLRNIPYFEETEKFTINLPNSWNFVFHFPTFMRMYLLMLCFPGMFAIMSHMNNIRYKKLSKLRKNK